MAASNDEKTAMLSGSDSYQGRPNGRVIACALGSLVLCIALGFAIRASAQDAKSPYPSMAPLEQYLIADQSAEIALARSAAPVSISGDAEAGTQTERLPDGGDGYERLCL